MQAILTPDCTVSSGGGGGGDLTFTDSLVDDGTTVTLDGDEATPAAFSLYGTDDAGARGWLHIDSGDYFTADFDDLTILYGIGSTGNAMAKAPGDLYLTRYVRSSTVAATLFPNDDLLYLYTGVGDSTLALTVPANVNQRNYYIVKNRSALGNVTVHGSTGDIDGAAEYVVRPGQQVEFTYRVSTSHWYASFGQYPASLGAADRTNGGREATRNYAGVTGATALDLVDGNVLRFNLTGDATLSIAGADGASACSVTLMIYQDGTGGHVITWPAGTQWSGGTPPTIAAGANEVTIVTMLTVDGGTIWYAGLVGSAYA